MQKEKTKRETKEGEDDEVVDDRKKLLLLEKKIDDDDDEGGHNINSNIVEHDASYEKSRKLYANELPFIRSARSTSNWRGIADGMTCA